MHAVATPPRDTQLECIVVIMSSFTFKNGGRRCRHLSPSPSPPKPAQPIIIAGDLCPTIPPHNAAFQRVLLELRQLSVLLSWIALTACRRLLPFVHGSVLPLPHTALGSISRPAGSAACLSIFVQRHRPPQLFA